MSAAADPTPSGDGADATEAPAPVVVGATRASVARRLLALASPVAHARHAEVYLAYAPVAGSDDATVERKELLPRSMSARVTVLDQHARRETAFEAVAQRHRAGLLLLEWPEPLNGDSTADERAEARRNAKATERLFLDPPSEAWLVRGSLGGRSIKSILVVPANGMPATETLRSARALAGSDASIVLLDVHGGQATEPSARLRARLDDALGTGRYEVRSVKARSRERAALDELDEHAYDVLFVEAPDDGVVPWLAAPEVPTDLVERVSIPTIVVNHPQSRFVVAFRRRWDRVYQWAESLDDEQRVRVYSDLRRSARADRDFLTLTVLATSIAALGLLLNSTAVIIGAMLVAPFMSPLIALGLAIVYGDRRFMRVGSVAILRGTIVAYPIGILLGLLVPQVALSDEILARTQPSGLDLLVAVFSGAAGAYAYARRDLSAALPGVAIAAALVPPLAASAIALGAGEYQEAAGAVLLYALNVTAISAAAALVFLWFGFRPEARFGRTRAFFGGFAGIILVIGVVLAAVIVLGGQDRGASLLERSVATVVDDWLAEGDTLDEVTLTENPEALSVRARIESSMPRTAEDAHALATLLSDELDRAVVVDLVVIPIARGAAVPPEEDAPAR